MLMREIDDAGKVTWYDVSKVIYTTGGAYHIPIRTKEGFERAVESPAGRLKFTKLPEGPVE